MSSLLSYGVALLAAVAGFALVHYLGTWAQGVLAVSDEARTAAKKVRGQDDEATYLRLLSRTWGQRMAPFLPEALTKGLSRQITMAGGLSGLSAPQVVFFALIAGLGALAFSLLLLTVTDLAPWIVLVGSLGGLLMPFIWLRDQVKKRHLEILADLPFHLDMLTLCVEAGLDFGAGVARMVDKGREGALREEFQAFLREIRIGRPRAESLQSLSERVGLEQLSIFLSALIQADRMGTGLAKTLRMQSESLRISRFQRAEKAANEAPVKMLFPLVIFIFPTIWVILGAPLVFDWVFGRGGF